MRLLGVDGCRGGWLVAEAVSLRSAPSFFVARHFLEIARLAGKGAAMICLALLPPSFAAAAPARGAEPFPTEDASLDDYLDALAVLVAAVRLAKGTAGRLPLGGGDRDARGLAMEMIY